MNILKICIFKIMFFINLGKYFLCKKNLFIWRDNFECGGLYPHFCGHRRCGERRIDSGSWGTYFKCIRKGVFSTHFVYCAQRKRYYCRLWIAELWTCHTVIYSLKSTKTISYYFVNFLIIYNKYQLILNSIFYFYISNFHTWY